MTYQRPGVYVNETLTSAPVASYGAANAAGAAIGAFPQGPTTTTLVRSWGDFVQQFGNFNTLFPATFGVNQFFANGGSELYVKRILSSGAVAASASVPQSGTGSLGTVVALNKGKDGNNLRIQITGPFVSNSINYYSLTVYKEVATQYLYTSSTNANNDLVVEQFNNLRFDSASSADYAQTVVNATSQYIALGLTLTGTPAVQTMTTVIPLQNGDDSTAPAYTDYNLAVAVDGTSEFDLIDRPLVIFAPNLYEKFTVDGDSSAATHLGSVHDALIGWANSNNGFAVIDTAPGLTPAQAIAYVTSRTPSSQAAAYYPNYYITDPTSRSSSALRKVSPAGAVAGVYMATDKAKGPFKAPAGVSAGIRTAVSLERSFSPADLDSLNSGVYGSTPTYGTPVNAIRNLPGAGVVIMGARTLLNDGTANRFVNTRRSLIYIKKNMQILTQFAVFRNNDAKLWGQISTVLGVFLNGYRIQGGLRGASPAQAYYVKADSTINTPTTIASGIVNIQVGVALQYPSEFVVINLSQITGN